VRYILLLIDNLLGVTLFMRRPFFLAAIAALGLVIAPAMADAAAGRGSSQGSRGSRTHSAPPPTNTAPSTAAPMQRSTTQPGTPAPGMAAAAQPSRGMFGGGLMGGLMGGLLGAGLIGMLMGGGFMSGMAGFMGFLGLLLQVALIGGLIYFAVRFFRRRSQPAMATGPMGMDRQGAPDQGMHPGAMHRTAQGPMGMGGMPGAGPMGAAPMAAPAGTPVAIAPEDYQAFEQLLQSIQGTWSAGDEGGLRQFTTPEMAAYFGEQLSDMERQGLRNEVRDVKLEQGDLAEAWGENGMEYATVAMRFSAMDVTRDRTGRVVEGDATNRSMIIEVWTFVRRPGDRWVLSAIQQTS
jgi:predicted lipid-binding transport protein (Tim44 family)